jgi:hypothetical protein
MRLQHERMRTTKRINTCEKNTLRTPNG